jgi:hypothetical protein
MRGSLGRLQHRGELRVRGCEKTGDLLGQGLVGRQSGQLVLPEVEITARQPVELGFVLFRGHENTIAHRPADASFAIAARLVALRYRR